MRKRFEDNNGEPFHSSTLHRLLMGAKASNEMGCSNGPIGFNGLMYLTAHSFCRAHINNCCLLLIIYTCVCLVSATARGIPLLLLPSLTPTSLRLARAKILEFRFTLQTHCPEEDCTNLGFRFLTSAKLDRHRGDRYGPDQDSHPYRHAAAPSRFSDSPVNHHDIRRSPNNFRGGVAGGHRRPFDSPPRYSTPGAAGFRPMEAGGGFRPIPGVGGGFGSTFQPPPVAGQKRGYPFSGRGSSPDHPDGGSFAKLFVGSVPRTATEEDIRPLFEEHGNVIEVALIKDKRTGQQQGCCFVKYTTSEEADRAIRNLHNQHTLPGGAGPIQVRYADGERERLGAVEYKLFVGSLNKQASEKEVKEIFSPYGVVEDVYLMRDEMKQSRGCGFVKYSHRDMAMAAINALNGIYTMRGCDQPLSVRFADPKKPRSGDSRGTPAFGGPGFGSRFQAPGPRPMPNFGEFMGDRIPIDVRGFRPPVDAGIHPFGGQLPPRSSEMGLPLNLGGPASGFRGPTQGLVNPASSASQQNFNQSSSQHPPLGLQASPVLKAVQSPKQLPPSSQLHPHAPSYSQTHTSAALVQHHSQPQNFNSSGQLPFSQAPPSQESTGLGVQLPASQAMVQQGASAAAATQTPLSMNLQSHSAAPNQHQLPTPVQPRQNSPSQLAHMLSQQKQTLQASFQSSQQAFSQLQQQLQLIQPSNQSSTLQPSSQTIKQQSHWPGVVPHTTPSATSATSDAHTVPPVAANTQVVAPVKCSWTEHTSPDGYKYYYNSATGESKWERPEELSVIEHQQKAPVLQPQNQLHPQLLSTQQLSQTPQVQLQAQFQTHMPRPQPLQQPPFHSQEGAYTQLQTANSSVNDPTRFHQGLQATQEWAWKNK